MKKKYEMAVLIPVFNNQAGLLSSLESLRGQIDFEHVFVVDDGSNPPVDISANYPVKLIKLEKNQGIVGALNTGLSAILKESHYEYVARLDAGDICHHKRLDIQLSFMESNLDVGVVGSYVRFLDKKGHLSFIFKPPLTDIDIKKVMYFNSAFCHPAVMMRIDAIKSQGVYDVKYQYAEDYELFQRILKKYKGANIPNVLLDYEMDPNGISLTKRKIVLMRRWEIQLKYFNSKSIFAWLGLLQTFFLRYFPNRLIITIKKLRRKN